MKVTLINFTPIDPLVKACAMPYQSKESNSLVKNVWESQHRSIARHGMASFIVKDVSVSLLTQISRHPFVNLTVMSSRYCDMSERECVIPPFVKEEDIEDYKKDCDRIMGIYQAWNTYEEYSKTERQEISKMFLLKASTVDLVVSGNYQALYEFLELRNCIRSEWEINDLARQMTELLKGVMPQIFNNLGCRGDEYRICPESHGCCGKYPTKKEVFNE